MELVQVIYSTRFIKKDKTKYRIHSMLAVK